MFKPISLALVALGLMGACATSSPAPVERLVRSQNTVRAAEDIGAAREPKAAFHLQLARGQLADAKRLMAMGENIAAEVLLQRAAADAELAVAYTTQAIARREAESVQSKVLSLRSNR